MFPARTWVDPGDLVTDFDAVDASDYNWQVSGCDTMSQVLDGPNYSTANWRRHVNVARCIPDQNVTTYQSLGDVYYPAHWSSWPESIDTCLQFENQADNGSFIEKPIFSAANSKIRETSCQGSDVFKPDKQLCTEHVFPSQLRQSDFVQFRKLKIPWSSSRGKKYGVPHTHDTARDRPSDTDQEKAPVSRVTFTVDRGVATNQYVTVGEASSCVTFTGDRGVATSQYVTVGEEPLSHVTITGDRGVAPNQYVTVGEAPVSHVTFTGDKGVAPNQYVTIGKAPVSHVTFTGYRGVATNQYATDGEVPVSHVTFTGDRGVATNQYATVGEAPVSHMTFTGDGDVGTNQYVSVGELTRGVKIRSLAYNGHEHFLNEVSSETPTNHPNVLMCNVHGHSHTFRSHRSIKPGEKPYQCTDCGKAFKWLQALQRHHRIHTGYRPYLCTNCGKTFRDFGNFRKHERIHTGEKPYQCPDCNTSFRLSQNLKKHQRMHMGEKPHLCTDCGKTFRRLGNFRKHERIHTGDRPYQCMDCGQLFKHLGTRTRHQRIHTGEKQYQ